MPIRRWQNVSDAENCLNRVKTKPVSLKSVLVPTCAVLITIAAGILKAGVFPVLPEFQYTLAAVTDTFYSMDYRKCRRADSSEAWPGYRKKTAENAAIL